MKQERLIIYYNYFRLKSIKESMIIVPGGSKINLQALVYKREEDKYHLVRKNRNKALLQKNCTKRTRK
jgi:hypothetical protein